MYEDEIVEINDKNKKTYERLEQISSGLVEKNIEFIKERVKYHIEECVKHKPEQTKKLNNEGKLKELKDSMNVLLNGISENIILEMAGDKVFIHRSCKPNEKKSSFQYNQIIKDKYLEVYQKLIGLAGEILKKFDYINVGNDYNGHSEWQYISGSGGKIKYGYGFDSRLVDAEWNDYIITFRDYYEGVIKYESLCKDKEQAEAEDLWDNL